MNKDLFHTMQNRLAPDCQVTAALIERLKAAPPAKKKPSPVIYAAIAACALVAIAAYPVYRMFKSPDPVLHSYVLTGDVAVADTAQQFEAGFSEEAAPAANDSGEVAVPDRNGSAEMAVPDQNDSGEVAVLDQNGNGEVAVPAQNSSEDLPAPGSETHFTGEIIEEADASCQEEAVEAYQNLMSRFAAEYGEGNYPDWYGGSYIGQGNYLTVNTVLREGTEDYDKEFYIQIETWAGNSFVCFGGVKYSLNFLRGLQSQITDLPEMRKISYWGCGVNETTGQVELDVPYADEALLAALAKLDPDDDAILVRVGQMMAIEDCVGSPED